MKGFLSLLYADARLQVRHSTEWATLMLFFLLVILLLPFAIGPDPVLLQRLAPGFIWLATLLMSLLALDKLFVSDERDGTLDLLLLSPKPLPVLIASKLLAQIIIMLALSVVMVFPAAILLGLNTNVLPILLISLLLGLPVLVLLGGMIAALTVGLPRNPALLTLLLIPFYIPVLIFAVAACDAALLGDRALPHVLLIAAQFVLLSVTAPFVIAGTLRNTQG